MDRASTSGEPAPRLLTPLLTATGSQTKVLLASVRDVTAIISLARRGVRHFTMAPAVADQLFTDELTAQAARTFEEAVLATST